MLGGGESAVNVRSYHPSSVRARVRERARACVRTRELCDRRERKQQRATTCCARARVEVGVTRRVLCSWCGAHRLVRPGVRAPRRGSLLHKLHARYPVTTRTSPPHNRLTLLAHSTAHTCFRLSLMLTCLHINTTPPLPTSDVFLANQRGFEYVN
jgi:hypothetical protein